MSNDDTGKDKMYPLYNPESPVIRWNETSREVRLLTVNPIESWTIEGAFEVRPYLVKVDIVSYIAIKHFNARSNKVIPNLSEMLDGCDIQISADMRDSQLSSRKAVLQFQDVFGKENTIEHPWPFAVLGAARSAVSTPLALLHDIYGITQMSCYSTSAELDDKTRFSTFTRSIPSNSVDALAMITFLEATGVKYVGVLYVRDSYGTFFFKDLDREAEKRNMRVVGAPYNFGDSDSVREALQYLKDNDTRHIIFVADPSSAQEIVRIGVDLGVAGTPEYSWILALSIDTNIDLDVARALHGSAMVTLDNEVNLDLEDAMWEFIEDTNMQQEYASLHNEPHIFDGRVWTKESPSHFQSFAYDAIIALGLAACQAPNDQFTRAEFHESLLNTSFEGVTGFVSFNKDTGTRSTEGLRYQILNSLFMGEVNGLGSLDLKKSVVIEFDGTGQAANFLELEPFVYYNNSTTPPSDIPAIEEGLNLIPSSIRYGCLSVAGLIMILSLVNIVWTYIHRGYGSIRIAQPIFLSQLCIGTFMLSLVIVPMSFQEPMDKTVLDIGCMITPWLLSMGFVTAFSALFAKTWRLNQLFQGGKACRRLEVKAYHVIYPFVILMSINMVFLIIWTAFAPLKWTRITKSNFDSFGRPLESYGTCSSEDGRQIIGSSMYVALVVCNMTAVIMSNYQSYMARKLPTRFNESFYVALTNTFLMEAFILGVPIRFVVRQSPSAEFLCSSVLVVAVVLSIQLPAFIPKYHRIHLTKVKKRNGMGKDDRANTVNTLFSGWRRNNGAAPKAATMDDSEAPHLADNSIGMSKVYRNDDYFVQVSEKESSGSFRARIARQSFNRLVSFSRGSKTSDDQGRSGPFAEPSDEQGRSGPFAEPSDEQGRSGPFAEPADEHGRSGPFAEPADEHGRSGPFIETPDEEELPSEHNRDDLK